MCKEGINILSVYIEILSVFLALCCDITSTEDTLLESTQEVHGTALLQKEMWWTELFSKYLLHWPLYKTGVSRTEWIRSNLPSCLAIPVPRAYTNILARLKTTPNSSFCSQPVIWKQGLPYCCFRKRIVVVWELVCIFRQWVSLEGWKVILRSVLFCCLKPYCPRLSLCP